MTLEDAQKIAMIVATADGGCPCCVDNLVKQLRPAFPDFRWGINADADSRDAVTVEARSGG